MLNATLDDSSIKVVEAGGGGTPSVGCSCPFGGLLLPLYLRNEVEIGEKADVTPPYGQFAVFFAS